MRVAPTTIDGMRFEKWHGLGNAYLLVEQPGAGAITPARVRRLCDVDRGLGSDGLLEIASRDGARAEIVIWNPDGSIAEMSGNGMRIAATWLARVAGATEVTVVTAGREVTARMLGGGTSELDVGRVEVGDAGGASRRDRDDRVHPGGGRQPARRDPPRRRHPRRPSPPRPRSSRRTSGSRNGRTSSSSSRSIANGFASSSGSAGRVRPRRRAPRPLPPPLRPCVTAGASAPSPSSCREANSTVSSQTNEARWSGRPSRSARARRGL